MAPAAENAWYKNNFNGINTYNGKVAEYSCTVIVLFTTGTRKMSWP